MSQQPSRSFRKLRTSLIAGLVAATACTAALAAGTNAPAAGEIQYLTINDRNDHWSGGTIVVGGTVVILPRNLLIDLPANRLTLKQIFEQAPADCVAAGESGLAKTDTCNRTGMGGLVSLSANRTRGGNVIAGDVFIEKAQESVTGTITYIDYQDGYFRVNGNNADPNTGVMVRLNDPDARHTVQQGAGCASGNTRNCSADPRFTLDSNNYTNVYSTGFPLCIPSTVVRTASDTPESSLIRSVFGVPSITTAAAGRNDPSGDRLCPTSNRPGGGASGMAADSRLFAPIQLGDHIAAEGNFETVDGVRFLSAHTSMVSVALTTDISRPDQPDYLFLNEVFMEGPAFQNQRMRNMFIGFTSVAPADVLIWSLHYDPQTNSAHEFPLASTAGCDAAAGPQSCTRMGVALSGWDIFRIRYDVDFGIGAKDLLNPCAHLRAEPRFNASSPICPSGPILDANSRYDTNVAEMMGILQPVAHEIQARTGRKLASMQPGATPLITLDVKGAEATNGQYLFPLGMNLGGIETAEMNEVDLAGFATPISFSGFPWNLDRRLSPGGCLGACDATPQPLDPFPFEGADFDPRLQAPPIPPLFFGLPNGPYVDANFTAAPMASVRDRLFSFVSETGPGTGVFNFNVGGRVLDWPPVDPAAMTIIATPGAATFGASATANKPPVAAADAGATDNRTPLTVAVLANDSDADGNVLTVNGVSAVTPVGAGTAARNTDNTVTYYPSASYTGNAAFNYSISDGQGGSATATVTVAVSQAPNRLPVANADAANTGLTTPVTIAVLANDTDPDGDPLSVSAVTQSIKGSVVNNANNTVTFTPAAGASGAATFTYTASDGRGGSATGSVTVNIQAADVLATTQARYVRSTREWRVNGLGSVNGATITIRVGRTLDGPVIGTATVVSGRWSFRQVGSAIAPDATNTISLESSAGGTRLAIPLAIVN